jgi:hypothetical protein
MSTRQILAVGLAVAMVTAALPIRAAGGQNMVTIAGTARKEAKKPYVDYTTRARNVMSGQIAGTVMLDPNANFSIAGLLPANYVVELLDHNGKVVCTQGPFNLTQTNIKDNVDISCNKIPAAWWLLGAAAAAGITAGVLAGGTASPSQ